MKKYLTFLLLLIYFPLNIYCQIINGTVLEINSNKVIQYAIAYFNGTSFGTYTDQKGSFEFDITQYRSMPLTISALGYYSVTLNVIPNEKPFLVYLTPKVFELSEVIVSDKLDAKLRERNLKSFKEIFLGSTKNASSCEIINEGDILIFHENDTLKAYSLNPILIINRALGYKISYYLDRFEFSNRNRTYFFTGNILFIDDININNDQKKVFEERRKVYLGSKMHFFRVLWDDKLHLSGFSVSTLTNIKLANNEIVVQKDAPMKDDSLKYLKYHGIIGISYFSQFPESSITLKKDSVLFLKNGYFDGSGISWEGKMESQRIADMLPYEYILTKNNR